MEKILKRKILAFFLAIQMIFMAIPANNIVIAEENNVAPITNPFTSDVQFTVEGEKVNSNSYRIPAMVTLADGTIVAAADIRWNTTYDGGCLDTIVARSTDSGLTWQYGVANYLGDNGNEYNPQSTAFIDPCLTVAADGKTVYMLCDLYPYGIALNGNGGQSLPSTDIGFTSEGYLRLSGNEHSSYDYYLKDGYIYDSSSTQVSGYTVDEYFNLYDENGAKVSNLFFADSPYKVVRTGFLYLISSSDGGENWSVPTLLDLKTSSENVCLASPGSGITTSNGIMVFPVYSYTAQTQKLGFIYSSDNGATWDRSTNFDVIWASESAVVEIGKDILRFFFRNQTEALCYVDYNMNTHAWGSYVNTGVKTNSNTQLSAITYSKTLNGCQVVLVSCPTGPNKAGSGNRDGSYRTNGKIFVGVVAADGSMTWPKSIDVSPVTATDRLTDFPYLEEQGFFAYSCLTERADGSIAVLYENCQNDWGAGHNKYFTLNAKAYSGDELGLPFDDEKVIDRTATIRAGVTSVTLHADPSESSGATINVNTDILPEIMAISGMYYDKASATLFYQVRAAVGFEWPEGYDTYNYISADSVNLRTDYGIAIPIVDFTNAAPLLRSASLPQPATYKLRSSTRTLALSKAASNTSSGLVLNKSVTDNGNGTYMVNLEAYTTGTVTVQQTSKPMDIVLVLDQSGSMAYCIGCGSENKSVSSGEYHTTYDVSADGTYYYKSGWQYTRLYYCSTCNGWHNSQSHSETKYQPKTYDWDRQNTQFYEECESRLDALKRAVQSFVNEVYEKAAGADGVHETSDDIAHRIAIVGFASESGYGNNTELLSISGSNSGNVGVQYSSYISAQNYTDVLQDLTVSSSKTMLDNAINSLAAQGATQADLGMLMAENIFENNSVDLSQRDRVTIMFTDGTPTTGNSYESTVANNAINTASKLKNTYGSTVYTVGVFDGADASSLGSLPANNNTGSNRENRYMHLVSSNYLNATNMTQTGILNPKVTGDNGYYLSASDSAALNNIFQSMSSQIGSTSMDLGSKTVVKDIVTPQFDLPQGVNSVTVKQVECTSYNEDTGEANWGAETSLSSEETVQIDDSKNSVNVTGFDFKHNYVAENGRAEDNENETGDFHGRKLVITFVITPDPDFLGGDNVETNGTESGVYDKNGTCVGKFDNPKVNVPLKNIETVAQNKHIYYGNITDLTGILNLKVAESNSGKYLQDIANGINNAYVDLVYTVTLNNQTVITYTIPAGTMWNNGIWKEADGSEIDMRKLSLDADTIYEIKCTMTSLSDSPKSTNAYGTATVYVYKPVLTFKDATKTPLKDNVVYSNDNYVSTVWKNGNTLSTVVTMEGTAPELKLTYTPDENCLDGNGLVVTYDDFYVNVTVAIGDNDITDAVTFLHQACDPACSFNVSKGEFVIHVVKVLTSLTIQKKGYSEYEAVDPNQTFLFQVTGENVDLIVTVHGNSSTTINGLKVGSKYTVKELTNWSWRYRFSNWKFVFDDDASKSGDTNDASVTLGSKNNTITFTNERDKFKWLDGDSWCNNIFKIFN